MANNIEHLMLKQFRRLDAKVESVLEAVRYIHTQQLADRHTMRGMQVSLDGANELLSSLTARVGRIERRLDLATDPVPVGMGERPQEKYGK